MCRCCLSTVPLHRHQFSYCIRASSRSSRQSSSVTTLGSSLGALVIQCSLHSFTSRKAVFHFNHSSLPFAVRALCTQVLCCPFADLSLIFTHKSFCNIVSGIVLISFTVNEHKHEPTEGTRGKSSFFPSYQASLTVFAN